MTDFSEQSRAGGARNALAEAADRFDRLARVVKDQQLSETRSGPRIALTETYTASPEEAWAKKFMTQAIGPATTTFSAPVVPAFAPQIQAPAVSQGLSSSIQPVLAEPSVAHGFSAPPVAAVPLAEATSFRPGGDLRPGRAIKTARQRRRSWLGWLLLGR